MQYILMYKLLTTLIPINRPIICAPIQSQNANIIMKNSVQVIMILCYTLLAHRIVRYQLILDAKKVYPPNQDYASFYTGQSTRQTPKTGCFVSILCEHRFTDNSCWRIKKTINVTSTITKLLFKHWYLQLRKLLLYLSIYKMNNKQKGILKS